MGKVDQAARAFGKDISDAAQEGLEKDFTGSFKEAVEGKQSFDALQAAVKEYNEAHPDNPVDKKLIAAQIGFGVLGDIMNEDLSCDTPYQPGSQQ